MNPHVSAPSDTLKQIYEENLDFIDRLAKTTARKHYMSAEDAEDFAQDLHLKLMTNEYAVLRKFQGASNLRTYLTTVAAHALQDFQNRRWGKVRPSAAAKDLGPVAVLLERLLDKGWSFDQACEILWTNHHVPLTRRELEEIWKRLPPRTPRKREGDGQLAETPSPEPPPQVKIFEDELQQTRVRVRAVLSQALRDLAEEERFIVTLVILKGFKIVTVAKILDTEPKRLYRRVEKIKDRLRGALEREEVRWEQVADLLNRSDLGWGFSGAN